MTGEINVLHVDDDAPMLDLTATFLEREDDRFAVETATDAGEGLSLIDDGPVDCVVSDYNMPAMDGLDFLEAVREEHPNLPFILFTGKGSESVASEAVSAGVTDYLQKGGGSEQYELLANRIRNAVKARRETRRADRQEELMRLTELAGDTGSFELDPETGDILLTEGARRILGEREEMEATLENSLEFFHPEERAEIREAIDRTLRTGEVTHGTWRYRHPDGDRRILEGEHHRRAIGNATKIVGIVRDITEKRERQRELEEERRFTQQALDTMEDLFYVIDVDGSLRRWNERVPEVTGYAESELSDMQATELFPEDERETIAEGIETTLTRGRATVEADLLTVDGRRIPYEFTGGRLTDGDGETTGLVGIGRDLSERRQRERRFRALIEESNDIISIIDAEGRFQYQSPSLRHVLGHDPEETVGDTAWEYIHPEDHETVKKTLEEWIADPDTEESVEYRARDADGSWHWMEANGNDQLDNPAVGGYVVYSRDITHRKERERELKEREQRIYQLQERTEALIRASTRQEIADIAVSTARDVLGLSLSGVHLVDDERTQLEPVAVTEGVREHLGEVPTYDRTAPSRSVEATNWAAFENGETIVIEDTHDHDSVVASETPSRSGIIQPLGDHGLFVTSSVEPKAFDDTDVALTGLFAAVVTAVLDRTQQERALREQKQRLEEKTERLEEFASVVSHDLQSPLGVADGRLELAREECNSDHLDVIGTALDRMEAIIEDVLWLAREGQDIGAVEPVDVREAVDAAWELVADSAEGAELRYAEEASGTVMADEERFCQLLENVLGNAIEHGGEDVTVTVGTREEGFYVADDGPGIPPEERDDVFDAGYSRSVNGTGLGLNIVERVVDAHGWDIRVTDSESGGARFDITGVEPAD
jgi:PAS domain S-box-containing protein